MLRRSGGTDSHVVHVTLFSFHLALHYTIDLVIYSAFEICYSKIKF